MLSLNFTVAEVARESFPGGAKPWIFFFTFFRFLRLSLVYMACSDFFQHAPCVAWRMTNVELVERADQGAKGKSAMELVSHRVLPCSKVVENFVRPREECRAAYGVWMADGLFLHKLQVLFSCSR